MYDGILITGFTVLPVLVAAVILWGARVASPRKTVKIGLTILLLMTFQIAVARFGVLAEWGLRPVPILVVVAMSVLAVLALTFSEGGKAMATQLPLAALIAPQVFRLPLELVMHHAANSGVMPVQMSYSGLNFDIITGLTALPVAWLVARKPELRWLPILWNTMGTALLLTIVTIAILSTPTFAAFGSGHLNTFIAFAPYVWLPGVLVPAALLGHLITWRKLFSAWPTRS
jgi:hypothetical protein